MTSPTADRRQGLVGNTPIKAPVDYATTANITLSGEQLIDGVLTSSSRVLVKNQTDATQNGIYDTSSAAWTRSADSDGNYDLTTGTMVAVNGGSLNANSFFQVSTAKPITIGSSILTWLQSFFSSSSVLSFIQSLGVPVQRSILAKARDTASVLDYGVVGNDATDDTAALNAALSSGFGTIEIPQGLIMKTTGTVVVPPGVVFRGKTGRGRLGARPSYIHVTNALASAAVTVDANAWADHINVVFAIANTAVGIQGIGNGCKITRCQLEGPGSDGIRVGTAGGANCNSFTVEDNYVLSAGANGCYIHDGTASSGANANAGRVVNQVSQSCTGSSVKLGHCFWVTVENPLGENCTRYAVEVSGTTNNGVPECRYASIMMGDANEGNALGAVFDQGYFTQWVQPDILAVPTNAGTGIAGSGVYQILSNRLNRLVGATIWTNNGSYPAMVDDGVQANATPSLTVRKQTAAGNNQGPGIAFSIGPNNTSYVNAAKITGVQNTSGIYGLTLSGYKAGAETDALLINLNAMCVAPATDNTISSGVGSNRWNVVYAATAAINTSDASTKQQIAELTDAEKRVAVRCKALMRTFRFNDSVAEKGSAARIHVGAIAQDVQAAFVAEGLEPTRYALFCSDTWWEVDGKPVDADENGIHEAHSIEIDPTVNIPTEDDFAKDEKVEVIKTAIAHAQAQAQKNVVTQVQATSVTRLGLRYEEMFAFIIGAL